LGFLTLLRAVVVRLAERLTLAIPELVDVAAVRVDVVADGGAGCDTFV
jgi:hypothetical protein